MGGQKSVKIASVICEWLLVLTMNCTGLLLVSATIVSAAEIKRNLYFAEMKFYVACRPSCILIYTLKRALTNAFQFEMHFSVSFGASTFFFFKTTCQGKAQKELQPPKLIEQNSQCFIKMINDKIE